MEMFPDDDAAREYFEKERWRGRPTCAQCGSPAKHMRCRKGYLRCEREGCRRQFTVRKGTVKEASNVGYCKWLLAMHAFHVARKGISSLQLAKGIGVTQKTAWFMSHRIREVMRQGDALGGIVEVDETYIGGKPSSRPRRRQAGKGRQGVTEKQPVMGTKEVGGRVLAKPLAKVDGKTALQFIVDSVAAGSTLHTDESRIYKGLPSALYDHHAVNHSKGIHVRGCVTINGIESVWALLKRTYQGVHHPWAPKHTHRYVDETAFRLGIARVELVGMERLRSFFAGAVDKRLTYKRLVS